MSVTYAVEDLDFVRSLTDAHDDTITEPPKMLCPLIGRLKYVMQKLNAFSLVDFTVLPIAKRLGQVLVYQLSH